MQKERVVILVVEDEQEIRDLLEEALSDGEFDPAITASGEEAITLLHGDIARYRALTTDINLIGRLTGWDVARRARELNPDIPVVYMTGAAGSEWASQAVPNSVLLNKPFAPAQVLTAVAHLLNATPSTAQH